MDGVTGLSIYSGTLALKDMDFDIICDTFGFSLVVDLHL